MTHNRKMDKEDTDIVEQIRSLPLYAPRLLFRLKVEFRAAFPAFGLSHSGQRAAGQAWGPRSEWRRPGSAVAIGAMALVVAFALFSGLMLASGGSLPGSPLYSLKRAREQLGLAMTWGPTAKAARHLALASSRLEELDKMSLKGQIDPGSAQSLAKDYNFSTAAVAGMLKSNPGSSANLAIAKQLQALQAQKTNVVKRLAAESPGGVLAAAGNAKVALFDSAGSSVLGASGRVQGSTDEKGGLQFDMNATSPRQLTGIDAVVEKDGRKAVMPVFAAATGNDRYSVQVEPAIRVVELNKPVMFTMMVTRKDGSPVGTRELRLVDGSRTSLIDGRQNEAYLHSDPTGSCTFSVTKISDSAVSRIALQVDEGTWIDAGQVLALGAVTGQGVSQNTSAVSAVSFGSVANPQSLELGNGLVRAVARRSLDGEILSSVAAVGGVSGAGPLYDPLPVEARALGGQVSVDGPRLILSNAQAAGYETTISISLNGGSIKKTYRVTLSAGDRFVVVECSVAAEGSAVELAKSKPALVNVNVIKKPAGSTLVVGGKNIEPVPVAETNMLAFEVGNPYVTFNANGGVAFAAFPIDSATFPSAWCVTSDSVSPVLSDAGRLASGESRTTMLLGVADRAAFDSILTRARAGIGDPVAFTDVATVESSNGFTILTSPGMEQLGKGKQRVTLKVFKQYEKVFENL
ncbi:MAG: DUF5667 domain-containing protein [Candidatus Geothermincolia bacterium]